MVTIDPALHDAVVLADDALLVGLPADPAAPAPDVPEAAPGAWDLLRALRAAGVRSAVVSRRHDLLTLLARSGIEELVELAMDAFALAGGPLETASAPERIERALEALSVPARRAALLARRADDLRAARAAGLGVVVAVGAAPARPEDVPAVAGAAVGSLAAVTVATPGAPRAPAAMPGGRWSLHLEGFEPADEPRREALCATGNGYLVSRGAAPEAVAGGPHYPGTYLAGVYNRLVTEDHGRVLEHEELVNAPNWLPLTFRRVGGRSFFGEEGWEVLEHDQALELRYGILHRRVRVRDEAGNVTLVTQRRLASMDDPHRVALETALVAENWSGEVELRSGIDGDVTNSGVAAYRLLAHRHLAVRRAEALDDETTLLVAETVQSHVRIAVAARTRCSAGELVRRRSQPAARRVDQHLILRLRRGAPCVVEKVASVFTSRDRAVSECSLAAAASARGAGGFEELASAHRLAWERLWRRSSLWVDVGGRTPVIVNLHLLHLLQSVSPHTGDLDAGVTARGLHGEAYRGHVFWDELFVLPLLNLHLPELARSLLRYRHRRLAEARRAAREAGYRGAMFPWQSGTTGREETPTQLYNPRSGRFMADNSHRQRHVGLAIAYNVWNHYQVTGDLEALVGFGAELMIEIARFWASAATYDAERDRFDIRGVMGPDEFHDGSVEAPGAGLVNNAYTNVMAAWALWRSQQLVELLRGHGGNRILERLDLRPEELAEWERVGTRLTVPFDRHGRIAQFEGYEDLEELDWDAYRARYDDIGRLDLILEAEGDTPNRYKVGKQADVLMLFYMLTAEELDAVLGRLGYRFDPATIPETINYYLARTSNGSTLSRVVHAWVLARRDRKASWKLLLDALSADIDDTQGGTTGEGIHLGAMAGTVDLLERCFVDLDARDDTLHVNPRLPDELPRLRFALDFRGHRLELDVTQRAVTVRALPGVAAPVRVAVRRLVFGLAGGEARTVAI